MTLRPALDRLGRGFRRMWAWCVAKAQRRPAGTVGQQEQARETEVSLGLMAAAANAGPSMTVEQQIFLGQSEHGMRERLSVLLMIPRRSLDQEREKLAIEGWLTRGAPASAPRRFFATVPAIGLLSGVRLWMILAAGWAITGGFALIQMGLKERIEDQRDEARAVAARWRERSEHYRREMLDAANVARLAADALEDERARHARAAARERRRNREIANVLAGSPEPPDWRLREPTDIEDGSASP